MLKKFVLLFIFIMLISNAQSQEENGYKGATWGMTKEQVKTFFGNKLTKCEDTYDKKGFYQCRLNSLDGDIAFDFNDNGLNKVEFRPDGSMAGYYPDKPDINRYSVEQQTRYENLKKSFLNSLSEKYGSGQEFHKEPDVFSIEDGYNWISGKNSIKFIEHTSKLNNQGSKSCWISLEYESLATIQDQQKKAIENEQKKNAEDEQKKKSALNGIN